MDKPDLNKPAFALFPKAVERVKNNLCPICGEEIGRFKDEASEREYSISGLCQDCQDEVFNELVQE